MANDRNYQYCRKNYFKKRAGPILLSFVLLYSLSFILIDSQHPDLFRQKMFCPVHIPLIRMALGL